MPYHIVTRGDCLSSIAEDNGFFWETLWDAPENAQLREARKDPNTLMPGDRVFIPPKRMKTYSRGTDARHTFRVKGVPAKFRIQLLWGEDPRAGERYVLTIDGEVFEGVTDGDGRIEAVIRPTARRGTLVVGEGERETEYEVELGALPPADEAAGALARLRNLGYCQEAGETLDDDARAGLLAFQREAGLATTGELDEATKALLRDLHDGA